MPETAISTLTGATELTDDDVLIVNDGATTKKITAANAKGLFTPDYSSAVNPDILPVGKYQAALPNYMGGAPGGAESLSNLDGYITFYPFWLPFDMDVDGFALDCYTGAAGNRYVALFDTTNSGTSGYPGSAIANSHVTIDMTAAGWLTAALGATITLTAGTVYWVGMHGDVNGSACRAPSGTPSTFSTWVSPLKSQTSHNNWAQIVVYKNGSYETSWPTNAANLDFTAGVTESSNTKPATLFLKRA